MWIRRIAVLLLGCLGASVAAGLVGAVTFMSLAGMVDDTVLEVDGWLTATAIFALIITLFGLVASLTFGLLAHALLTRLRWTGWLSYTLAGLAAGALLGLVFSGAKEFIMLGTGLGAGVAAGLVFRAIVRPKVTAGSSAKAVA